MNNYNFDYNQYHSSINKKNNFSFYVIFLLIIILLGLYVFVKPQKENFNELYFVEIANFETYHQAIGLSQKVISNQAAGYIFFDGKYHVLASFYLNKNDAKKVVENIKNVYANACVFSIQENIFFSQKSLNNKQNKTLRDFINSTKENMIKLQNINLEFDSNKISFNEFKVYLHEIKNSFDDAHIKLTSTFENDLKFNIIKDYAKQMSTSIENIIEANEQNANQIMRYEIISFVINRNYLVSCF